MVARVPRLGRCLGQGELGVILGPWHGLEILKHVFADSRSIDQCADAGPLALTSAPASKKILARHCVFLRCDCRCEMGVIVSVSVSMLFRSNHNSLEPRTDLGVVFKEHTDIVSVPVAPDNPRHFGLSSRQRTLRTRGSTTICRKI